MSWVTLVRALLDLERGESLRRLGLDGDVVDFGQARAAMGPVHQAADLLIWPLEDCFDPAVGKVAYPSGHAVLLGQAPAGVTEEDTLDAAGDQHPIAKHMQTVRREGLRGPTARGGG